ncbi:MAG: hypothetical protein KA144_03915 [Xanthomonadaceae bacterium]|nr:hypothetical protein [Xanthomonadaceae bacterium]
MSVERHPNTGAPVLLVADGGVQNALPPNSDPIADWIDWMEAVEAVCPERVEREEVGVGLSGVREAGLENESEHFFAKAHSLRHISDVLHDGVANIVSTCDRNKLG